MSKRLSAIQSKVSPSSPKLEDTSIPGTPIGADDRARTNSRSNSSPTTEVQDPAQESELATEDDTAEESTAEEDVKPEPEPESYSSIFQTMWNPWRAIFKAPANEENRAKRPTSVSSKPPMAEVKGVEADISSDTTLPAAQKRKSSTSSQLSQKVVTSPIRSGQQVDTILEADRPKLQVQTGTLGTDQAHSSSILLSPTANQLQHRGSKKSEPESPDMAKNVPVDDKLSKASSPSSVEEDRAEKKKKRRSLVVPTQRRAQRMMTSDGKCQRVWEKAARCLTCW